MENQAMTKEERIWFSIYCIEIEKPYRSAMQAAEAARTGLRLFRKEFSSVEDSTGPVKVEWECGTSVSHPEASARLPVIDQPEKPQ